MKPLNKLLLALLLAGQFALAADDKVMLNFVNTDIESAVKAVSLITGKNFIISPQVKGTLNVISSSPVDKHEAYPILLSALRQQGFAVVEMPDGTAKIVQEQEARYHFSPTYDRKMGSSGDRIVTQVYPLKNESAIQMVAILRPLVTAANQIAAYAGSNTLVITDYADNIKRLTEIIADIDKPSVAELVTLPLQHASALELSQTIAKLMPEVTSPGVQTQPAVGQEGVKRSTIIADVRANTLLIRSENPAHIVQIRKLVEALDRPGSATGTIRVVYLKNASANRLAAVLKGILTGQDVAAGQSTTGQSQQVQNQVQNQAQTQTAFGNNGGTSQQSTQPINRNDSTGGTSAGGQIMPGVWIVPDVTTNSLIINAPDSIYNPIRAVIDKLDMRRAQVFVEAMVAEVNVSKSGTFGVQWLIGGGNNNVSAIGATSLGAAAGGTDILSVASNLKAAAAGTAVSGAILPAGASIGIVNGSLSGGKVPNLGLLASAIESDGGGTVLSMPNLVTVDNEEARILVGQNVPFVTGSQQVSTTTNVPFQTVQRQDIGISLVVKPQVSDGGAITMDVKQEVSSIDTTSSALTNGAGLVTTKRSLDTRVIVDDGQVVVLGGLLSNQTTGSLAKVPLLGDIPILGNLFRYDTRSNQRTNLMIFLRPIVVRDGESAHALANERYQSLRETQEAYQPDHHTLLPDMPQVVLPSIDLRTKSGVTPVPSPAEPEITPAKQP